MAVLVNELTQKKIDASKALNALLEKHGEALATQNTVLGKQAAGGLGEEQRKAIDAELATADSAVAALEGQIKAQRRLVTNLEAQVAAETERLSAEDEKLKKNPSGRVEAKAGAPNFERDPRRGYADHREYFRAVKRFAAGTVTDERLKSLMVTGEDAPDGDQSGNTFMMPLAYTPRSLGGMPGATAPMAAAGSDEQGNYDDRFGGALVGRSQVPGMFLQIGFEGDPTAGLTQPVPMQTAMVDVFARTDKDHTTSVSGGFVVTRKPETVQGVGSRAQTEAITLKAHGLFGFAFATEEQIQDALIAVIALIDAGFRDQFAHQVLVEKLRGGGGNEYLGVITALASANLGPTISIAKESGQANDTISYQNVIKMRSRNWGFANAIWLANHDTYPQLSVLHVPIGTGGQLVYQTSLIPGRPDTLLGRPIFYTEYASTLGDQGDLILGNWSQYLEGVYQPLQSSESIHVRFLNNERTFKFWLRNAGAPWWKSPLTPHKGASSLSPFVVLDAR